MSAPPASMVKRSPSNAAQPGRRTWPTSPEDQGAGSPAVAAMTVESGPVPEGPWAETV
jgi:hypothetical protein